jgi:hypothetical protein
VAQDCTRLIHLVKEAGGAASPNAILKQLAANDDDRLYWLPIIWHAVLTHQLAADWDRPLDHDATLHVPDSAR